ncbi:MAG: ATP-grasp domain-containing protein [Oscillospiraceae bacterium]|nr:ATP-grasp domain-containing protein [Oscillospiraceae bacterium]
MNSLFFLPVLLGSDMNVYGMARSFHEAYDIQSVAIAKKKLGATMDSKIVKVLVEEPNLEDDEVFVKTLVDFAGRYPDKTLLLVPCGDNYIKLLVRNQEALRPYYKFECISEELLMKLSIKESFYQVCTEHGFAFPKTTTISADSYKGFVPPFDFPVVIKPSNSVAYWNCHFPYKKKVFVANDQAEFDAITEAIYGSTYQDHLIIQEFIPGDDSGMRVMNCFCGKDKKVKLIALGHPLLEEHSPEGIGSYAAIIGDNDPALARQMKSFLEGIGYVGFANFDMKYDPRDGKYKLFEMNLRQGRSSFFVTAEGYNLATFLVNDVLLSQPMGCVIATDSALWSVIPKSIIFKYVKDEDLKEEARQLIADKHYVHTFHYEPDMSLKRWIYYLKNQLNYFKKYRKYYGNKGLH